jgi:hypothetical protein
MPLRKQPGKNPVNERLRGYGRGVRETARIMAPGIQSPEALAYLLETTRRDIYAETVDALGFDPLAKRDGQTQ